MDNRNEQPGREDRGGKGHEGHELRTVARHAARDYEDVREPIAEDALRVMNQVGPRASTSKSLTDRSKSKRYDAFLID